METTVQLPEIDVQEFEKRRLSNYLKEKNFMTVERIDENTFTVSNSIKKVSYSVTKNTTEDGIVYAECSCRDWQNRGNLYSPPAKCKHIFACLDWRKSQEKHMQQAKEIEREEEKSMSNSKFNPQKYLTKIKGKDYLEVKFRLHWFRQEHREWSIKTAIEKLDIERGFAVVRSDITDENGNHKSSGMSMENSKNFQDYLEKAETSATGRALAALGYGTIQSVELDEGKLADAPVEIPQRTAGTRVGNGKTGSGGNGKSSGSYREMPEPVRRAIEKW